MNFWLQFEIVIIYINKTLNLQGIMTFQIFKFIKKGYKKNMSSTWTTISIYYTKCKNIVPKFIHMKKQKNWENGHVVIF
jgi:hypothetical protein